MSASPSPSAIERRAPLSRRKDTRVSYLLTTRNRADCLRRALENVREFLEPQDELIVIDAASTDETRQVVEASGLATIFESSPDRGEAHGFNKGILQASGRWIKLLTDDDLFYPDAMRHAIRVLEENPQLDALLCGGEKIDILPDGTERFRCYARLPEGVRIGPDGEAILRWANCGLGLWLRRESIAWMGLLDASFLAVDSEYMARLIRLGADFRYLDVNLYRHRVHAESAGARPSRQSEMRRDLIRVRASLGLWEDLLACQNGFLTLTDVRDALGWPLSDAAMELLGLGARWRQAGAKGRLALALPRALVWALAKAFQGARKARLKLLGRGKSARRAQNPLLPAGPSEPPTIEWTGELR
jgi:glycosyltransferase involved in cell wall biosynthesis